jgi:hypothetical protein
MAAVPANAAAPGNAATLAAAPGNPVEGTTYSEIQREAFCGIHAMNMLFQERKVVWFPGCPIYLERDILCALDNAHDAWTKASELKDTAMAHYTIISGEITKAVPGSSLAEKKQINAAFKRAKLVDQKSIELMETTDAIEEDIKAAAFDLDADEDTIEMWSETNDEALEEDATRVKTATTELKGAKENQASSGSALNAYAVKVAERNLWWATFILERRKAEWARFKMVRVGKRAEIILSESKKGEGKVLDSTKANVLFNVAEYCSESWGDEQKDALLRNTLQEEVDRIVARQSGPEPEVGSPEYAGFMKERRQYTAVRVNATDSEAVMQHLITTSNIEANDSDLCTVEMQGADGNLPAALIEHILWPEFRYQHEAIHCQSLASDEWSASVKKFLDAHGALGAVVNYLHPQVSNHYCAVIKFPNSSDPTKPYAIGDSILESPETIITYYSLDEIIAKLLTINPIHITCVFAQVEERADTEAVRRMIESGQDVESEEEASPVLAAAAGPEAAAAAGPEAAPLEAPLATGGSRKTRRTSKPRRNKSNRRI